MGLNLSAVRARLDQLKNVNKRSANVWKPEPGEHTIRIVPYIHNTENTFIEMYFHYNLGKKNYVSPMSHGNPDPIVEFAEELKSTGEKEDWLLSKKLQPKLRVFVPVIIRGKENEGVKFWSFGKQVYQQIFEYIADPDYGDITDLKEGHDIRVTIRSAADAGKDFAETTIRIKPKKTPAVTTQELAEKLKNQVKITEIHPEPTYQELKAAIERWLQQDDDPNLIDSTPTKNQLNYNESRKNTESDTKSKESEPSGYDYLVGIGDEINSKTENSKNSDTDEVYKAVSEFDNLFK